MFLLLSWLSFLGFDNIPQDRNTFANRKIDHCLHIDKSICSSAVDEAYYTDKCINKAGHEFAKANFLMVTCTKDKIDGICACSCLDPSSLIRVFDKEDQTWKDIAIEKLEKVPSAYQVMAASYEKGELQVAKADFEVLTCDPKPLLEIHFSNQTKVLTSYEHPFQTVTHKNLKAQALKIGDEIPTEDNSLKITEIIKKSPNPKGVMNILIKGTEKQRFILVNDIWTGDAKMQENMH